MERNFTEQFKNTIRQDFEEWLISGECRRAAELNDRVGEDYFDTAAPHYFTGDLTSELVLIHLNPKRNKDQFGSQSGFSSFEEYWEFYTHFGRKHYGVDSERIHKSPFDHKQIRFLQPFNILPFTEGDVYHNLEMVVDKKLQIELIPYGSPDFNYKTVGIENLKPFIDDVLNVILSHKRKYVIFCGRVFCPLLQDYIIEEKTHSTRLTKTDGSLTKDAFELIKIKLQVGNQVLDAAIAPQFAKQGAPISRYGDMVAEVYSR